MARQMNFSAKIESLETKIVKKQEELKKLKIELADVKAKKADSDYKVLIEYMEQNGITAEDVLGAIKPSDENETNETPETTEQ